MSGSNLYEWSSETGELQLVNILPGSEEVAHGLPLDRVTLAGQESKAEEMAIAARGCARAMSSDGRGSRGRGGTA